MPIAYIATNRQSLQSSHWDWATQMVAVLDMEKGLIHALNFLDILTFLFNINF